jgi:prepilin-type N-terminal cleavage/methylation domain-containing protein
MKRKKYKAFTTLEKIAPTYQRGGLIMPLRNLLMRRQNSLTGFTLVEILLALAILGVGLVSVLSLFTAGLHSTKSALDMTRAGLTAQLILETLKQQGYQSGSYSLPAVKDYNNGDIKGIENFSFSITTTQAPIPGILQLANWSKIELVATYATTGKEIGKFITYITKTNP